LDVFVSTKDSIYRTSKESPIMEALKDGARNGKKVTVYVEIKARFDELNNVRWATMLRHSGVRVVRPMSNFKVHCKMTQILRTEDGESVSYLHLGTGNYHPGTARLYTDLGLLTRDPALGREISSYFAALVEHSMPSELKELLVAPLNLHKRFLRLIREEIQFHQAGGGGHIIAKMNSLVDTEVIEALYEASSAGVKVELIVRGICCLRPGIKGLSENIRVFSVVDRFLEHSRVYYFRSGGPGRFYLSSADWMPRNFHARYEIAFPVKDPLLKQYLLDVILATSLADNVKAWTLGFDGHYLREAAPDGVKPVRSQFVFEELARKHYAGTILAERKIPSAGKGSAAVGKKD
jgi:polyphosphate kinase